MTRARGGSGVAASSGGSSGGGPTVPSSVVHALQTLELGGLDVVVADQLAEIPHPSSPSSSSARRRSADRVRVLTVPSGTFT